MLAENLLNKEKLKITLHKYRNCHVSVVDWDYVLKDCTLSPAELAPSDEDRRKADLWEKLYEKAHKLTIDFPGSFGEQIGERIKEEMDELLAQAKEEKR